MDEIRPPRSTTSMVDAFRALFSAPFRTLVLLSCFVAVTSASFDDTTPSEAETAFSILLLVIAIYVQIAIILAAGSEDPAPSADAWLLGAFKRRCFWRFVGTTALAVLALFAGVALVGVGVLFVGAVIGLCQSACVLERLLPFEAITKAARIGRPGRVTIGVVFFLLVLVPSAAIQVGFVVGWADALGALWIAAVVAGELVSAAGSIALTRIYVALGGEPTPPPASLAPRRPDVSR